MAWDAELLEKELPKLNNPVLIEGLPGIGNVGKIAADFLVDNLKAKKIYSFFSYSMPHSVFVNDKNLVELPSIEMYYKKMSKKGKRRDLLILVGDVQPMEEVSSYEFSEKVLDVAEKFKVKEIVTMGGIGLPSVPKQPKVYCTANCKEIISRYKFPNLDNNLYGVVGPIIGVSGLLLGLGKKRKIEAIALLAETLGHPMYLGMRGAKETLIILDKKFSLGLSMKDFDKEIKEMETELKDKTQKIRDVSKIQKLKTTMQLKEASYIG